MLTKIELRAPGGTTPLTLDVVPSATTRYRITSVNGLGPVKADITSATRNQNDGNIFQNRRVGPRNIVITMEVLPDYQNNKSVQELRRDIYRVAGQNKSVEVTLFNTEMPTLKILGYVEDIIPNIFTKDTLLQISIVCPSPYYEGAEVVVNGTTGTLLSFDYEGDVETGFVLELNATSAIQNISIQKGQTSVSTQGVNRLMLPNLTTLVNGKTLKISTMPGDKGVYIDSFTSLLRYYLGQSASTPIRWFTLVPGPNRLQIPWSGLATTPTSIPATPFVVRYKPLYEGI